MHRKKHECAATHCKILIPMDRLMCKQHWIMVPPSIKSQIQRTYWHLSDGSSRARKTYLEARRSAIEKVRELESMTG